jgi:membrane protease YdiL (CAAX protease family)
MSDITPGRPWWEGDYVLRPAGEAEPASPRAGPAEALPRGVSLVACWRCDKDVEEGSRHCPFCHARLRQDTPEELALARRLTVSGSPVVAVVWFFLGLLLVSLVQGMILSFSSDFTKEGALQVMLVAEAVWAVLVLVAVAVVRDIRPTPTVPPRRRAAAWLAGLPVLAALLGLNVAYHTALKQLFPILGLAAGIEVTPLTVLVICVLPALIEELFFRYLALGALLTHMGLHSAVLVSSIMFGAAHVGQPLGIPVLIVIGMGLAYMRLASGGLALPVLMHFLHNLAVIYWSQ